MRTALEQALKAKAKLQVTVWDPEDESVEYVFSSCIKEVVGSRFSFAPPTSQAQKIMPLIKKDQMLGVVLETYPNPFIFYPTVTSLSADRNGSYWVNISDDTQIDVIQRRRHVRIPMVVSVEVEYQLGDKWLMMSARTEDISGGGMRLTSLKLFVKGQRLRLHFQLNPADEVMHLQGTVVFSAENPVMKNPGDLYATACQFDPLTDAQEMMIVRECFRRELKQKQ